MSVAVSESESRRYLPWLLLLFIGSGCAALIYEIVWFQLLQLVIGMTSVSLGLLLGIFMGGMCLGSLLLPRFISVHRHPLRVYALLELGIAGIGMATLVVVPWVSGIYTSTAGHGMAGMILRGTIAGVCLLPPTILMGATLPAMARWIESTPRGVAWLGFFYGGNIVGAVVGCLLAGFYLLRVHDMATATYVAAVINVVVAAGGFVLAAKTVSRVRVGDVPGDGSAAGSREGSAKGELAAKLGTRPWPVYIAIGLSGMAALAAEVIWTRILSLTFGGTVYTFSIILAVFLVGLGLGSSVGSFLARTIVRPRVGLGWCQVLLMGAVAWTGYVLARSLPYWPVNPALSQSPWINFQMDLARCLWAILPATILWGASFPLALAAVVSSRRESGRTVGEVYAANTVGAILGAAAVSLIVIPWLGTQWSQRIVIAVSAIAGLLSFGVGIEECEHRTSSGSAEIRTRSGAIGWIPVTLGAALLLAWSISPIPWGLAAYGRFLPTYGGRLSPEIVQGKVSDPVDLNAEIFCSYFGEGLNGTVAVSDWGGVRSFHSAGKVQASNDPTDMRLQRMLGHLSALLHERPESVLVVACGAGVTAGSFVVHPEVKRIVICDIEPLVPKFVAPKFAEENYNVVEDPRTQIVVDDGRHFVRTSSEKFDIITSDPIDPWVKGCAALNTVEYYEMCKQHLKPGGVMSLWIPLYESNSETVKSVLATFFKVFPSGILWSNDNNGEGYDAVLFGQAEGTQIDLDKLHDRLNRADHARVKQSLSEVRFDSALQLLGTYAAQAGHLTNWLAGAQINTDRNLRLQYLAGMSFNSFMGSEILNQIKQHQKFPENLFVGSEPRKQMLRTLMDGGRASANAEGGQNDF